MYDHNYDADEDMYGRDENVDDAMMMFKIIMMMMLMIVADYTNGVEETDDVDSADYIDNGEEADDINGDDVNGGDCG